MGVKMKLIDKDILNFGESLIEPFNHDFVTPNGYDLSIEEVEINGKIFNLDNRDIPVPAKTFFRVMTRETVNLPESMVAQLWLRSTYARNGIQSTFGFVDAGFRGKLALSLYNTLNRIFLIRGNEKRTVCQIVFENLRENPTKSYEKRTGNYQDQSALEKKSY